MALKMLKLALKTYDVINIKKYDEERKLNKQSKLI